jgi:hypothetical protein
MKVEYISIFLGSVLLSSLIGCQKKYDVHSEFVEIQVSELRTYDHLTTNEDLLLGLPIRFKYDDNTRHLFILDPDHWGIIEIDNSSNVINKFGRRGHGPGEVQFPADFFITEEHLFIVDNSQQFIHKYSRRDGQPISSLDYGKFLLQSENISESNVPPPPPKPPFMDNNNQPFVTLNETILIPSQANGKFLYQAINWDGDKLADIGEIPTKCTAAEVNDDIRSALVNREVPARDSCLAFPVNDHSNPEEIYLVYSAIPRIAKYSLSGRKIWEQRISPTPEVDSLMIDLGNIVRNRPNRQSVLLPVRKYIAGRSSPDGDLYLVTYTNLHTPTYLRPMWIHQFDYRGMLVHRYIIVSNDVDLYDFPGIDFERRKMFVPMFRDSKIRVYDF